MGCDRENGRVSVGCQAGIRDINEGKRGLAGCMCVRKCFLSSEGRRGRGVALPCGVSRRTWLNLSWKRKCGWKYTLFMCASRPRPSGLSGANVASSVSLGSRKDATTGRAGASEEMEGPAGKGGSSRMGRAGGGGK